MLRCDGYFEGVSRALLIVILILLLIALVLRNSIAIGRNQPQPLAPTRINLRDLRQVAEKNKFSQEVGKALRVKVRIRVPLGVPASAGPRRDS